MKTLILIAAFLTFTANVAHATGEQKTADIKGLINRAIIKLKGTGPAPLGMPPGYEVDDGSPSLMMRYLMYGPEGVEAADRKVVGQLDNSLMLTDVTNQDVLKARTEMHLNIVFGSGSEADAQQINGVDSDK